MEIPLRSHDRLVQFRIRREHERGILLMQSGESCSDFVFLTFSCGLESGSPRRHRVNRRRSLYCPVHGAERVASIGAFKLNRGPNVPGTELVHGGAIATIEKIDLPNPFGRVASTIKQIHAGFNCAGINAEKPELTELLLIHYFEHLRRRFGVGESNLDLLIAAIQGGYLLSIDRRGTIFRNEIHQARNAHTGLSRDTEQRGEKLSLNSRMDTAAKLLFRESALIEELRKLCVIGLSNEFDQFAMKLSHAILPVAFSGLFREPAPASGLIGNDIVAQYVENLIKARPGIHRHVHRKYTCTVLRTGIGKDVIEICVFLVHGINNDDLRDLTFGSVIPNAFGTYSDPVLGVNDDQREVGYP